VSVLWITGGLTWDIPHCESTSAFFAMNIGSSAQILTIFDIHMNKKLVSTHVKNIFLQWKTL
jgi:hypothetical protein